MLKDNIDKLKALVQKKNGKDKKKIENLIFFLILLVVTLITINFIFKGEKSNTSNEKNYTNKELVIESQTDEMVSYQTELKKNLEDILSKIKGVGKVEVLITYNQSSKITPMYNETSSQSVTEESDSDGGSRKIESYDTNKQVVSDSGSNPVTERVTMPEIEGAIVIAEGASSTVTKNNIIGAVEAATGLSSHKIQVFEMKD